nr:CMF_HP1_G0036640.mRNA.1.CDS.1 [Saccharomyces cerevisiae]
MVEIDSSVIELSRKFLPTLSNGAFDDERLDLKLCDGFKFLQDIGASDVHKKFDVIITDSSDPEGPSEAFFQERKISEQEQGKLKYYNPQIHSSAFVLPTWADKVINE